MADEYERDEEREHEILISDKRHSRDVDAAVAAETEEAAEPEQPAADAETENVVEFTPPERESTESAASDTGHEPTQAPQPPTAPPLDDSPEAAQLLMLFEAGLPAYLHSQLQLILNFAMIYLGRHPNPATGLVSADLDKARLAIDLFDFIIKRTQDDLPEPDRSGLANLVGNLKMEYAQAASSGPPPPVGSGEA